MRCAAEDNRRQRAFIAENGITPDVFPDHKGRLVWNGVGRLPDGGTILLGTKSRSQLCRMMMLGDFGDDMKNVVKSANLYWQLRDKHENEVERNRARRAEAGCY